MADQNHHYPDKSCSLCSRMGCVYFDAQSGNHRYLCIECMQKNGIAVEPLPPSIPKGSERDALRRRNREYYLAELARQMDQYLRFGIVKALGLSEEEFSRTVRSFARGFSSILPLSDDFERIDNFPFFEEAEKRGHIPFVLVATCVRTDFQRRLELACEGNGVEYNYLNGDVHPRYERRHFLQPTLSTFFSCIFNVSPDGEKGHQTMTIDEGVAIATQFPEKLKQWESLVSSASRYTRVTETDVLFVCTPTVLHDQFCVCYMPERRMRELGREATCEMRLTLVDLAVEQWWRPIESRKL